MKKSIFLSFFVAVALLGGQAQAAGDGEVFEQAVDEVRSIMRAQRRLRPGQDEDFFIGTASSYIELWESISGAFFAVFVMVSAISAVSPERSPSLPWICLPS